MANINEIEQWDEGIYQLEKNDPVEGGKEGIDNVPHKHLANRTKWLKKQVEDLQAEDIALDTRITDAVEIVSKKISPVASHTIQNMDTVSISNTKNKMSHDVLLYKGQTVTDANGETLAFNISTDILPYKGTFWNGAGSTIALNYYTDESETTTASIDVLDQTSFINLGVGSIDFTKSNNGTGYYHDRDNVSGIGGDCKIVNDSGDSRFIGTLALPEDKFIIDVSIKDRDSNSYQWYQFSSLRGVGYSIKSSNNGAEGFDLTHISGFNSSGIDIGVNVGINASADNYRLEYTVYTHIVAGDTEQGKPYIYAWNPITNDVLGLFKGSGQVGHKVPMPFKVDYCEFKNTDTTDDGIVFYGDKDKILRLYSSNGGNATSNSPLWDNTAPTDTYFTVTNNVNVNKLDSTIYFKGKESSEINKIGTYIGNGGYNEIKKDDKLLFTLNTGDSGINASGGNYVYIVASNNDKIVEVVFKRIDSTSPWTIFDYARGEDKQIFLNLSNIESSFNPFTFSNQSAQGSKFNFITDSSNLNLTNTIFRYTNKEDEKGYILSSENITATIPLSSVSDGEKWIGKEENGSYIFDNMEPEFNSDGTVTRVNYDENGLDEFDVVGYTGNGSTQTIKMPSITSGVDFVWIKERNDTSGHYWYDSIRGAAYQVNSHATSAEVYNINRLTQFNSAGFNIGSDQAVNELNNSYIAWCASLPNHTPSNTNGTITSETKSNDFMSAISYTGNSSNATIGHGLTKKPELIIIKIRNAVNSWYGYNKTIGNAYAINLNDTSSKYSNNTLWNSTDPTDSVFSVGNLPGVNNTGNSYIAYAFTSVEEKCKVGAYDGTGANGNKIECDFEPTFVMIKRTDSTSAWSIVDNVRSGKTRLLAQSNSSEVSTDIEFKVNGFTINNTGSDLNTTGGTYIYLAIAKTTYTKTQATTPTSFLKHPVLVVDEKPQSINTDKKLPENVMKDTLFKGDIEATDIKVNGEFIGKNACTAWVNFDGTTTPPTIRDSFNVKDIVRTSIGNFEIYFENEMDNTNYTLISTCGGNDGGSGDESFSSILYQDKSKFGLRQRHRNISVNTVNTIYNSISIYGGKN